VRALFDWLRLFSAREAVAARGRMAALVAVVAVSSALLVAVLGVIGSIDSSAKRLAEQLAGKAVLEVTGIGDGGFSEDVLDSLNGLDGVSVGAPFVQNVVTSSAGDTLLLGADPRSVRLDNTLSQALSGRLAELASTRDGLLAGPGMGVVKGDQIRVGSASATVVDILQGADYSAINGGRYLVSPLRLAQRLAGRDHTIDGIYIIPKAGADVEQLRPVVTAAVGGRALVVDPQARSAQSAMGVNLVRFVALSSGAITFVVSGFLIYTATGMSVAARRRSLSALRAIGARPWRLVLGILGEVALYGLIGGAIGAVGGFFIGQWAIGRLPDTFMQTVTARIEYHLPVWAVPVALAVAVVASMAAAALAARQVYRVSPVEAMAPVGVSSTDTVPAWMRAAAFVVFVVLAAAAFMVATSELGLVSDGAISMMFGALLALGFAVGPLLIRACAALAGAFGAAGVVAGSAVSRAPGRVWATMMTVSIAVAATLAISGGGGNAIRSALKTFASYEHTDIWVSTSKPGLFPTGPLLPSTLHDQVASTPGVAAVMDGLASYATVGDSKVMLYGLSRDDGNPLLEGMSETARQQVLAGGGVVLSRDLAQRLKLRVGDTFTLHTAQGDKSLPVLAVVPFFSGLTGALGLQLGLLRNWFHRGGETTLQVSLAPGTDLETEMAAIRQLAPQGVHVYSGRQAVGGYGLVLRQAFDLNNVLWVIVVVIAAIALLNMLMLSVLERRRELGVLGAIGASRRFVLKTILIEGVAIGVTGGVVGVLFGLAEQYVSDFASSQVWAVDVRFEFVPVALFLALGALVVCVVGSVPPALTASRGSVVEAVSAE
jgi:putative ABC transport system permease protein